MTTADVRRRAELERRLIRRRLARPPDTIPRLRRGPGVQRFATSEAERHYWRRHRDDPTGAAYVVVGAMTMDGPVDVAALGRALTWLGRRHEPLRTRYVAEDGVPVALVDPEPSLAVEVRDCAEAAVDDGIAAVFDEPFDLAAGPPARLTLLRTGPERHVMVLVLHHIIGDLRSQEVFCGELAAAYAAEAAGRAPDAPPLPVQCADVVAWQTARTARGHDRIAGHWRARLAGAEPLRPPADLRPDGPEGTAGRTTGVPVPDDVIARLREIGAAGRSSLFMVTLAAFALLLGSYSGQDDVVLASPVSLRDRPETQQVLGAFVNEPPFRVDLSGDLAFRDLLARVRDGVAADLEHRALPVSAITALAGGLDLPVLFAEETDPDVPAETAGLSGALEQWVPYRHAQAPFGMRVTGGRGGHHLVQTYRTALYSEARVAAIARDYLDLLTRVAADPGARTRDPAGPCGVALRVPTSDCEEPR